VEVSQLLVGEIGLLEEGGELLLGQVSPLLCVADELAQLVGILKRRYFGEKNFVFGSQPYVSPAARCESLWPPTRRRIINVAR
jgi:hypothetical protein